MFLVLGVDHSVGGVLVVGTATSQLHESFCRFLSDDLRFFILHLQALLDVYTIEREIGRLDGISLGLVGDLANGRTVRSLAYLIAKYQDVKVYFVSPDVVKMKVIPRFFHRFLKTHISHLSDGLKGCSICRMTSRSTSPPRASNGRRARI